MHVSSRRLSMYICDYLKNLDVEGKVLVIFASKGQKFEFSSLTKSDLSFEIEGFVHIKKDNDDSAIKIEDITSVELFPNPNIYSPD